MSTVSSHLEPSGLRIGHRGDDLPSLPDFVDRERGPKLANEQGGVLIGARSRREIIEVDVRMIACALVQQRAFSDLARPRQQPHWKEPQSALRLRATLVEASAVEPQQHLLLLGIARPAAGGRRHVPAARRRGSSPTVHAFAFAPPAGTRRSRSSSVRLSFDSTQSVGFFRNRARALADILPIDSIRQGCREPFRTLHIPDSVRRGRGHFTLAGARGWLSLPSPAGRGVLHHSSVRRSSPGRRAAFDNSSRSYRMRCLRT